MQDKRLLICDDEAAFGRFVQNVAEDLGHEVRVTTNGPAFIEAYNSFKPTTIILDMIMPGMDGNELVLWLAKQECTARLVIITGSRQIMRPTPKCWRSTRACGRS
jgi:CheY-like chemotaxis protein